ncbi:MAG TPA: type II toxin-antitoxin system prevent-host-death family antitoxin [Verrucomicrobiota bacterium]|nr:type II toxin-antitoxin system prevent-host-death family antitoxin [Verrucomicrobiota bacterium]HRZ38415.1 type II toxin-antitoxin system prevent-host-death family antitoxin [Candidatus Paceibacterota bacterium]HRZ56559.1 type II toxin-antitoxin system prevent-host-death family antitoxin [Candidatus Paceibacterota bacterium]
MKTATVRQLRHDFGSVLNWVEAGESVGISKRGTIVALLSPPPAPEQPKTRKRPDFLGRLKRIYGDRVVQGDVVVEERNSRSY